MKKKILYGVLILLGIIVIAFVYYVVAPAFIKIRVDEAVPVSEIREQEQQEQQQEQRETQTPSVSAQIIGTTGHPASGTVRNLTIEGKQYIRYENFKTINGPDLYVYLAKDLDAKEYVNLGVLRATEGNVNYEVPADVNVSEYRYVMVWCKQFSVLFNYADMLEVSI